jgi:hypothetical protein
VSKNSATRLGCSIAFGYSWSKNVPAAAIGWYVSMLPETFQTARLILRPIALEDVGPIFDSYAQDAAELDPENETAG